MALAPEQTRQRIVAAADALFGERGFDGTTTRDIADRAGVNKALLHYHFGTKDELFQSLLDGYYERLAAVLAGALHEPAPLRGSVVALVDAYADFLAENRSFMRIVHREIASGHHVERIVARTLPMFRLGVSWLERTLPGGTDDLEVIHLLASVYGMVATWFAYGEVLAKLTGRDPFSPESLAARKRHVHRVVELLVADLEERRAP